MLYTLLTILEETLLHPNRTWRQYGRDRGAGNLEVKYPQHQGAKESLGLRSSETLGLVTVCEDQNGKFIFLDKISRHMRPCVK